MGMEKTVALRLLGWVGLGRGKQIDKERDRENRNGKTNKK